MGIRPFFLPRHFLGKTRETRKIDEKIKIFQIFHFGQLFSIPPPASYASHLSEPLRGGLGKLMRSAAARPTSVTNSLWYHDHLIWLAHYTTALEVANRIEINGSYYSHTLDLFEVEHLVS